jgi:PhnB protein
MNAPHQPAVTFAITVASATETLAFYTCAFEATELYRLDKANGDIAHAECVIGNSCFFISDEAAEWPALVMLSGMTRARLFEFVTTDCDHAFARAIKAGASVVVPPRTQIWGSRHAVIRDPFGYYWTLSQETTLPLDYASHESPCFAVCVP